MRNTELNRAFKHFADDVLEVMNSELDDKADLENGKVPASQLPSYVDDVLEYSSTSSFPATGENGKIYVATDTNRTYRWGGSAYVEISESLALGETASTAYPGSKGKANADAIVAIKDGTTIDSFADVETALANIPSVTVDQTYDGTSANAQSGVAIEGKKPGLKTTGKRYTIDDEIIIAGIGAETFNNLVNNKAMGPYSHAEGDETTASGTNSHAEGSATKASGAQSHAEGASTKASGAQSHAEGSGTIASGSNSHSEGQETKSSSDNQHVQGKYNVEDVNGKFAFIIGNGTSDSARHDAFAIDWNGLIYVNGASTGVDVSAFPSPTDINTAITKANAAAPQSTTYTKTEVDTALAAKLNTADVDADLSSTSTNPVQNKAVQAPVARLVDAGAKNLLLIRDQSAEIQGISLVVKDGIVSASGTATGTPSRATLKSALLPPGEYTFSGCPANGSDTTYRVDLYTSTDNTNYTLDSSMIDRGTGVAFTISTQMYVRPTIRFQNGYVATNLAFNPMLCTAEDYAISSEFVPYAKSNYELTQATEPIPRLVDAGAKNILKIPEATQVTTAGATFVSDGKNSIAITGTVGDPWGTWSIIGSYSNKDTIIDCTNGNYVVSVISETENINLLAYDYTGSTRKTLFSFPGSGTAVFSGNITNIQLAAKSGTFSGENVKIMICSAKDYAISSEFVPYAKSNYELTQDVEPIPRLVDSGAKNLLKIVPTSQTINGVTFTVNADQTVTVNGTNTGTGTAVFMLVPNQQAILIPDGDYWFSGCPQGGGDATFDLRWFRYSPNVSAYDRGSGAAVHKSGNTTDSNIAIVVKSGVTVNNITFKPMLCTAEDYAISPEFVPYAPSNRELYEMILALQNAQNV